MINTPEDKIDSFSVPYSAGHKSDNHTEIRKKNWVTTKIIKASKFADNRPIDIFDKPTCERHMPIRPELPNVLLDEGPVKIFWEPDADQMGAAYGKVSVACEVKIRI